MKEIRMEVNSMGSWIASFALVQGISQDKVFTLSWSLTEVWELGNVYLKMWHLNLYLKDEQKVA